MKDKLIEKLNSGDVRAFEQIVTEYGGYVYSVVKRRSGGLLSPEDAEELTADTFAALWRERENIDPSKPIMPYLAAVAGNAVISRLRALRLTVSIEDINEPSRDDLAALVENRELTRELMSAVDKLTDKQREVFVRFYFYGETTKEIAGYMGLGASDVRTTLHRAREKLMADMKERGFVYE